MSATVSDPQMAGVSRARRLSEQLMASSQNLNNVRAGAPMSVAAPIAQALAAALAGYQADSRETALNTERRAEADKFNYNLMGGQPSGQAPEPMAAAPAALPPQAAAPPSAPPQAEAPAPNIYGRNQAPPARPLDGDPVQLAALTEAGMPAGQPRFNPAVARNRRDEDGNQWDPARPDQPWDAGIRPPTGRVMPLAPAGAPSPSAPPATPLANSLGGAPAPTTPLASRLSVPTPERLMAAYAQASASPNPQIRAQAPQLLQMAQFGSLREDRTADNARGDRQFQAGRDDAAAQRAQQERMFQLQAQGMTAAQAHQKVMEELARGTAARAGLPQGYEPAPGGGARPIAGVPIQPPPGTPAGYRPTPEGGLAPIAGGPADPSRNGGPYQGTSIEAQDSNILLRGDPNSQEYAAAYARQGAPRINIDGSRIEPNMQAYRVPTYRPPGGAPGAPAPDFSRPTVTEPTRPTADQGRVATYVGRMQEADRIIANPEIAASAQSLGNRAANAIPLVGNYLTGSSFQQMSQAQRDFINAVLRRESGAVIGESEFASAQQQYFPQPGDSPEVLRQKQANRANTIAGMSREAGPAAPPQAAPAAQSGWSIRPVQ